MAIATVLFVAGRLLTTRRRVPSMCVFTSHPRRMKLSMSMPMLVLARLHHAAALSSSAAGVTAPQLNSRDQSPNRRRAPGDRNRCFVPGPTRCGKLRMNS